LKRWYELWALRRSASALTTTVEFRRKGQQVRDRIQLIPVGRAADRFALRIERTLTFKGVHSTTLHWISTNCPIQNTLEHLMFLYEMKREHWQVETFHKVKDERFDEDRFRKTPEGARRRSVRINGALRLLELIGQGTSKTERKTLLSTFLADFEAWVLPRALNISQGFTAQKLGFHLKIIFILGQRCTKPFVRKSPEHY